MSCRLLPVLAWVVVGCGAAGPPAGPKYVPSNSDEAATSCPKERKAAQEAREQLLGSEDRRLVIAAAETVMAQARCEASVAVPQAIPSGTQDQIVAQIRSIRVAVRDASSLFAEVRRYDVATLSREALVADARLTLGFAVLVGSVRPPADLEPRAAVEFQREIAEAKSTLETQAASMAEQALASDGASAIRDEACEVLVEMGRDAQACGE